MNAVNVARLVPVNTLFAIRRSSTVALRVRQHPAARHQHLTLLHAAVRAAVVG